MGYNLAQSVAIAIIGGADGPTSIYISEMRTFVCLVIFFLLAFVFVVIARQRKCPRSEA